MPRKFKITFDAPADVDGNVQLVIDANKLESDSDMQEPTSGPLTKIESPDIAINTSSTALGPAGPATSVSSPDVQILPIATSTTGQADTIYRTPNTGIIMTWTEAVNGFTSDDISVSVRSNLDRAMATICNFKGAEGSTSYTAQVNFPSAGSGLVIVSIGANTAQAVATMNEGPVAPRYLSLSFDFASGVSSSTPEVEIQLPAASPYVGRTAPIQFLWNIPVTGFTAADVTFSPSTVTMSEPTLTSDRRIWEAELTLPAVTSPTLVTVTVAENSVSSQEGVDGPTDAESDMFTYDTPPAISSGAPTGATVICDTEMSVDSLNYLASIGVTGGAVYGVTDLTKVGNNLFGVAQVRRRRDGRTNELADSLEASAALFRVNLDTNTCTIIKAYPSILEAARSIVSHNSNPHWVEGSGYLYTIGFGSNPINNPRVGNLGRYDISGNCVATLGKLWRTALGRQLGKTFEKDFGVAGGTFSPLISTGNKLLALAGSGNVDYVNYAVNRRYLFQKRSSEPSQPEGLTYNVSTNEVENLGDWQVAQPPDDENLFGLFEETVYVQEIEIDARAIPPRVLLVGNIIELSDEFTTPNALYGIPTAATGDTIAAQIDNWGLISFSNEIEPRVQLVETNGVTPWRLLLEFARLTQTILSFQSGLVFFKPRIAVKGVLTSTLSATGTSLDFRYTDINRPFPASGSIVIGSEVITYSSVGTASLGALARATSTTNAVEHASGTRFTLVDHVLTESAFATPIEDVVIESDATNLFNSIIVNFDNGTRQHREKDETSIMNFGEHEFSIDVPFLSRHQTQWAKWCAEHALNAFKDLQSVIRLRLHPRFDINVGDYIFLAVPRDDIRRIGLVIRVIYTTTVDEVQIEIRTITP